MRKVFKAVFSVMAGTAVCFSVAGCSLPTNETLLGKPAEVASLTYEERNDEGFNKFLQSAENFACELAPAVYESVKDKGNFAMSPVSVFMALSLASECASGGTREEILSALGTDYTAMSKYYSYLYRMLERDFVYGGKTVSRLSLSNSVWLNGGMNVNTSCIDALSQKYYGYSYTADFLNGNEEANRAVRNFVKQHTNGVIDRDFNLPETTLFALINTLYLKAVWNTEGSDLPFTNESYSFLNSDGTETEGKLLQGYYSTGQVFKGENYTSYCTSTAFGYSIKFIKPDDGVSADSVFTESALKAVNSVKDYNGIDEENKIRYFTRCIFPEFDAECDSKLKKVLKDSFGITDLFDEAKCDYSNITADPAFCADVAHVAKLKVDKKGIEGAAVTIIENDATAADPFEYENVYSDFVLDRAFAFTVTDASGVTLFSGVVNSI